MFATVLSKFAVCMDIDHIIHRLASQVGKQLRKKQLVLVTAESCTGGLVAAAITAISGSSAWFDRGFVTYSNQSKIEILGVPAELISQFSAVSEAVAQAMTKGALSRSHAQFALATTGIAGPSGGSADKPVGTVCFAWSNHTSNTCKTLQFYGDRQQIRLQAVAYALRGILNIVECSPAVR